MPHGLHWVLTAQTEGGGAQLSWTLESRAHQRVVSHLSLRDAMLAEVRVQHVSKKEKMVPRHDCSLQAAVGLSARLSLPTRRDKDICTPAHDRFKTFSVDRGSQLGKLGEIGTQVVG